MPVEEPRLPPHAYDAARQRIGGPAREAIAAARWIVDSATALHAAPQQLRAAAQHQVQAIIDATAREQLAGIPIDDLRPHLDRGARLGALEQAGVRTVADAADAEPQHLTAIPGVGEHTATQVVSAARAIAHEVARATPLRIDPDREDPAQALLLAIVAAINRSDAAALDLAAIHPLAQRLARALPAAERARSTWRMLFTGTRTKHRILAALIDIEHALTEPASTELQHRLRAAMPLLDPRAYPPGQVWQWFRAEPAGFYAYLSSLGIAAGATDTEGSRGYVDDALARRISEVELDASLLRSSLRGYQRFGAQFMLHRKRTLLGDEMGLGKTVQALAVLAHLAARDHPRSLVVCPASVLVNWLKETSRHSALSVHRLHGRDKIDELVAWRAEGGVAVTTFGTVTSLGLEHTPLDALVVDEAHYVKNPDTQRSGVIRHLAMQAEHVMFLSGTPMENRVAEFKALVGYLQPEVGENLDAAATLAGARAFRRRVAPVYLRRNQEDVLVELPERIDVEEWVELTAEDEAAYRSAVVVGTFMRMRRAAWESPRSAKLQRLLELVDEAQEDGHKVLVFSFFRDVLDAMAGALGERAAGAITGAVPAGQRQQLVEDFAQHAGTAVLLCQIDAGGVGLNIQAASVVILAEPQWKPSSEEQAIARAHRMGQVRAVQVHRLLAKDTVDEHIRAVQEHKRALFDEFARTSDMQSEAVAAGLAGLPEQQAERAVLEIERARLGVAAAQEVT
ncbi:ATP-dependent helicase [Hoyosella sp. G463]|uniref:ATP-dependent helicase n=1 Tax=Lolliginicoccus lacisalsi TaxID=2742202 RepID=A0A927PKU5_9ACTN|nr:SNF2-related protein [Lolliginicoccus lacisalsi]MBD8505159.1 ATP-dependent helicase [Lolliginicoccus lacisalsi]